MYPNPVPPPSSPSWRAADHDICMAELDRIPTFETVPVHRHSTKIHSFFGLPPSASPTNSPTNSSRTEVNTSVPSEPRSSSTYFHPRRTMSSKLREQYPTIKMHTRRTTRFLSILIQTCSPVW